MKLITTAVLLGFALSATALSQEAPSLPDYKLVPPAIKARILPVDAHKGYLVKQLKPEVYLITDGGYQSLFVTTGKGEGRWSDRLASVDVYAPSHCHTALIYARWDD